MSAPATSKWLAPEGYVPRHDPNVFRSVARELIERMWGVWRYPSRDLGIDPTLVFQTVEKLRRLGYTIETRGKGHAGYMVTDLIEPRYLRLAKVPEKCRDSAAPPESTDQVAGAVEPLSSRKGDPGDG